MAEGFASVGGPSEGKAQHRLTCGKEKVLLVRGGKDRRGVVGIDQSGELGDDGADLGPETRVVGHGEPGFDDRLEARAPDRLPSDVDETRDVGDRAGLDLDRLGVEPPERIGQELGKAVVVVMECPRVTPTRVQTSMTVVAAQPFSMSTSMAASASAALVVALRSACVRRVVGITTCSIWPDEH